MNTTVKLLNIIALFSSCARLLVRPEPIFRDVQGFRSRYFDDDDYTEGNEGNGNGEYENKSIHENPGREIIPMVANKGTTTTAEPISNPRLPTTTTNCEDDEEECDNNVEKNETATPATPTKEVSTERPPEIREKNVSKSTSSSTLPTTTTNCEDDEEECDNNVEKNETATPALIACSITHSWSAPELTVTGSLYCKGKPIVHTRVALLDGEYGYNMDDQVTGQEGNFSLRVKTKNEELNRKDWYFHAEPDCGRKAYQIQVNVLKNKCMARGSARIDVESIQPSTGEVIVEEYNLD
ncbi:hypothetical protein V3C99_002268 [Haemonchus contortus]